MDRSKLASLVTKSTLLSSAERDYWLKNLPTMSDIQCRKLSAILAVPDEFPFQSQMEDFFGALGKAAEKALAQHPGPLTA